MGRRGGKRNADFVNQSIQNSQSESQALNKGILLKLKLGTKVIQICQFNTIPDMDKHLESYREVKIDASTLQSDMKNNYEKEISGTTAEGLHDLRISSKGCIAHQSGDCGDGSGIPSPEIVSDVSLCDKFKHGEKQIEGSWYSGQSMLITTRVASSNASSREGCPLEPVASLQETEVGVSIDMLTIESVLKVDLALLGLSRWSPVSQISFFQILLKQQNANGFVRTTWIKSIPQEKSNVDIKEELELFDASCEEDACNTRLNSFQSIGTKATNRYSTVLLEAYKDKHASVARGIPKGRFLIEYVEEVLDMPVYEARQREYASKGHKHFYFMTLNGSEVIDVCAKGNLGRFINHSCEPNCRTEKWMVNGEVFIGLFAIRDIKKGEELTFDYNYVRVFGVAAKKCVCGSSRCRGVIGGDSQNGETVVLGDYDEEDLEPATCVIDKLAVASGHVEDVENERSPDSLLVIDDKNDDLANPIESTDREVSFESSSSAASALESKIEHTKELLPFCVEPHNSSFEVKDGKRENRFLDAFHHHVAEKDMK
ncbi:hypothetical protein L6452_08586 [Arctium lappa]|uniref:Uncharacterized protein n=1 Tax=Arctium lappa TaxID=4217 RepID=A0ACB9DIH6_ARCLA|nr:hypothetical protein L6452_08586 [Arctium lappa]